MGMKRRAMHNPKFKNSRPERWAMGERMRARNKSNSETIEQLAKVEETRTENVPQINKVVTNVTEETKIDLKQEVVTDPETTVTETTETPKPKLKRTTRKKTTAKAKPTTQTKAKAKPKTTRRKRTKKTA